MLSNILNKGRKEELLSYIEENPQDYSTLVDIALSLDKRLTWRATWLLNLISSKKENRISPQNIQQFIDTLENPKDGYQREILKLLLKVEINEDQEGILFDTCLDLWQNIKKSPSVRITALQHIIHIIKKYPELTKDIKHLTQEEYIESLSTGIQSQARKLIQQL
ncbi:MAG: hypothetical protein GY827_02935 [Cytophagales bacterium]|nr:hypothetical protein [Cytophagales bacterium]